MERAYICCPLSGDIEGNIKKAIAYAKYVFYRCEMVPIVPHFYSYIFDENNPEERVYALTCDLENLLSLHDVWVFGDHETEGMKYELSKFRPLNRNIHRVTDEQCEEILKVYG